MTGDPQKVVGKRGAAVQVKIPVTVKTGYHVNSNTPSEEYLIPLKLTWTSTGALEGGTVTYPKPAMEKFYKALTDVMNRPEHAQFNQKYGLEYDTMTMAETQAFLMNELDRMAVIARRANIKMD